MAAELRCEFACPGKTYYDGRGIRPDAQDVQGEKFIPHTGSARYRDIPKSGCQLKVFNDGQGGLVIEEMPTSGVRDITCVGPSSPDCPKIKGFRLERVAVTLQSNRGPYEGSTQVARLTAKTSSANR